MDTKVDLQVCVGVDWVGEFVASVERQGRSTHSLGALRCDVNVYAEWYAQVNGEPFSPEFLTRHDLVAYRKHCLDVRKVKPATWNRYLASLRKLFEWARERGYIEHQVNIFEGVLPKDESEQAPKWLSDDEYGRFMRQVERSFNAGVPAGSSRQTVATPAGRKLAARDWAMVALMIYTGLREGEVTALDVDDIKIGERSGMVYVRSGKGDKAREINLNSVVRMALRIWLEQRGDEAGPLFLGKRGRLGVNGIQERVDKIAQEAKIGHITPHQLRHTFCRRTLVKNSEAHGAEAMFITAKAAGHKRLDTTRRYVGPGKDEMADALERII